MSDFSAENFATRGSRVGTWPYKIWRRVKMIIAWWIRHGLQLLFFLPVRKNRILISAHNGLQYYCNPKYISEYLVNSGRDLEIIWGFIHPGENDGIPKVKAVRIKWLAWFYYSATASVIITNTSFTRAQPKRKGQLMINTWHGGGAYKRVENGVKGRNSRRIDHRVRRENVQKIDLFLSSSRMFTEYALRQDFDYHGEVLCCGMPRNDLFFHEERKAAAANRVRAELGIPAGRVVIYAPTYRGLYWLGVIANDPFPYRDVLDALRQRFGEPVTILKRAHPGLKLMGEAEKDVLDVTDYPDMQELMCAADMLITDYSSSMWDFAVLGRPCLLYVPDLEAYTRERGLCLPIEEWPGIVCRDREALLNTIRTLDEGECARIAARHLQACGSYETGTATEQVCARILRHVDGLDA